MTPMEKATEAVLNQFLGGSSGLDELAESIAKDHAEAAVTAYLTALSEDEGTVEKVARQLCPIDADSTHEMVIGNRWYQPHLPHWHSWIPDAKAALTALASRDERKE